MIAPKEAEAQNTLFAPTRFVNDNVFLTKTGEVGVAFSLTGIDAHWQTDAMLADQHEELTAIFRAIPAANFRLYQYLVKTEGAQVPVMAPHENELVQETIERRQKYLASGAHPLCTIRLYLVLLYEPKTISKTLRLTGRAKDFSRKKVDSDVAKLMAVADTFRRNSSALFGTAMLDKHQTFQFFKFLVSLEENQEPLVYDNNVDFWMSTVPITRHPQVHIGNTPVHTLTCRRLPQKTWPVLMRDLLKVRGNFIVCHQYAPKPNEAVVKEIAKDNKQDLHRVLARTNKEQKALAPEEIVEYQSMQIQPRVNEAQAGYELAV